MYMSHWFETWLYVAFIQTESYIPFCSGTDKEGS